MSATVKTKERYIEAVGRRKTATCRARLTKDLKIVVNGKDYKEYFKTDRQREMVVLALKEMNLADQLGATIKVNGGGLSAQAESVRHAISRALVKQNEDNRKRLRRLGFLTRNPKMVERKHYGLKKARKAPQWSKR